MNDSLRRFMGTANPLSYSSGSPASPPASPSEFDHAYERERGRWLRRRFLYYSGLSMLIGLLVGVPISLIAHRNDVTSNGAARAATLLVSTIVFAAAFAVTWRSRPEYARVLRLALATYVFASMLTIVSTHFTLLASTDDVGNGFLEGVRSAHVDRGPRRPATRRGVGDIDLQPNTRPASSPAAATAATSPTTRATGDVNPLFTGAVHYSYITPVRLNLGSQPTFTLPWAVDNLIHWLVWAALLGSFAFNHLFISCFLPWTVRDSLRPARLIALAFLYTVGVDTVVGPAWWPSALAATAVLPFMFAPGTIVCWWRYSRFNQQFKQRFESDGFHAMQGELTSARRIHEAMLPAPISDGPTRVAYIYEPMRQIGGDLLLIHRDGTTVSLVLFDVMGHGVSAALSVSRLVGEIERTFADVPDAPPERVLRNLNRYVGLTLARQHVYVTAIAARFDSSTGRLTYANAGHPPAIVARAAGGAQRSLDSTAMMLGVCEDAAFACETLALDLASGDAFVAYTDGASEAADPQGAMIGTAGLDALVARLAADRVGPSLWPEAMHRQICAHRTAPPQDDTLIVTLWLP